MHAATLIVWPLAVQDSLNQPGIELLRLASCCPWQMHLLLPPGSLRVHFSGYCPWPGLSPYRRPGSWSWPCKGLCLPSSSPTLTQTRGGSGSGNGKPYGDPISQRRWMGWKMSSQTLQIHFLPSLLDYFQGEAQGIHAGWAGAPSLALSSNSFLKPLLTCWICSLEIKFQSFWTPERGINETADQSRPALARA